jgi:DivIVA domain-containing protein
MPLDRQSIEKRDFPIGRRGYEPEAVDAHLERLAAEVEELAAQGQPRRTPESLAAVASQQVASIIQAAETAAADIERLAREEAESTRSAALADASSTRETAIEQARSHVGKVTEATAAMLHRVDAMESELTTLTDTLRTGAHRLQADLSLLHGNMDELYASTGAPEAPAPRYEPEPVAPQAASAAVEVEAAEVEVEPEPEPEAPEAPVRGAEEEVAPVATPVGGPDEDVEGARLIALNMALNGTPRDETDRYLAENFDLSDREGLLDEVYASVG